MARRQTKKSEERISLSGNAKILHKVARFVLFPIFHPFITLGVVVVLWLAPTFMGAKPTQVHKWYGLKIKNFFASEVFSPIAKNVMPNITIKSAPIIGVEEIKVNKNNNYDINQRRKMFLKAQSQKKVIHHKDVIKVANAKEISQLRYLSKPETITGKAAIIDANQIMIGNRFMFLHGIYVNPASEQGQEAEMYLVKLVSGRDITCNIVAYSMQGAATAYCLLDGMSINHAMVEKGLSRDVGLGE